MARTFGGTGSDYLKNDTLYYNPGADFTVVFRAKTSSDAANMNVLGRRGDASGGFGVGRAFDGDRLRCTVYGVADIDSSANAWPADGNYKSCIVTKSGSTWTLYVDSGTSVGSGSATYVTPTDVPLYIGGFRDGGASTPSSPFNGGIYDVALFPSVLDSTARAAFLGGTAPGSLGATADHIWLLNNASAGDETDTAGSSTMTEVGTVGYEATGGGGSSSVPLKLQLLMGA